MVFYLRKKNRQMDEQAIAAARQSTGDGQKAIVLEFGHSPTFRYIL